jgi:thiamine biosynthesis lipoprotein
VTEGLRSSHFRFVLFFIFSSFGPPAIAQVRVVRQVHMMGTEATLEIYSESRDSGLESLERFVRVLEDAETELSTWQPDSVLSLLNRHPVGSPFEVDESLCEVVTEMFGWHRRTQGAFDPTVGSLIDAWGLHDDGRVPGSDELASARHRSGMGHLRMDAADAGCTLTRLRDVQIDVGGFGKGEGLDRVRRLSEANSGSVSENWMINLGGQVIVHGRPPEEIAWEVGLAHPIDREETVRTIQLTSGSIATSGGSESDIQEGGLRLGHILDPRSGETVVSTESVAVWHADALVADILSTALYVMGVDQGLAWAKENGIAAVFMIPRSDAVDLRASSLFERTFPGEN